MAVPRQKISLLLIVHLPKVEAIRPRQIIVRSA
jgi:hypothetical protein